MDDKSNVNMYIKDCENVCTGTQVIVQDPSISRSIRKNTIDFSESWISQHRNLQFISVPGLEPVIRNLEDFNIAIITGISGDGKTTLAAEAVKMRVEASGDENLEFLTLKTPSEWQSAVNANEKFIILIDDIFGSSGFDHNIFNSWKPLFSVIMSTVKYGKLRLIMTIRKDILAEAKQKIDVKDREIFDEKYVVDISGDSRMTLKLKRKYIETFLSCCEPVKDVSLQNDIVLSDLNSVVGFPTLCHLFFSDRTFLSDRDSFLGKIYETVQRQIEFMRVNQPAKYLALVMIFFLGSSEKGDVSFDKKNTNDRDPQDFIDTFLSGSFIERAGIDLFSVKKAADFMNGIYTQRNINGTYSFNHECLRKVMFLSMGILCPTFLIQECEFRYLLENTRITGSRDTCLNRVVIHQQNEDDLFLRLSDSLVLDPNILNSYQLKDACFVHKYFDFLSRTGKLTQLTNKKFDSSFLENFDSISRLFEIPSSISLICFSGNNYNFLTTFAQHKCKTGYIFNSYQLKTETSVTLKLAIMKGNIEVAQFLVDHGVPLDDKCLLLGSCNSEMISFLLLKRRWPVRQKCSALFVSGYIGNVDIAAKLIQSNRSLLFYLLQMHKTLKSKQVQKDILHILRNTECRTCSLINYACMTDKVPLLEQLVASGAFNDDRCSYCLFNSQKQCLTFVLYLIASREWPEDKRAAILRDSRLYGTFEKVRCLFGQSVSLDDIHRTECMTYIRRCRELINCILLKGRWNNYQKSRAMVVGCSFGSLNIVKYLIQNCDVMIDEGILFLSVMGFSDDTKLLEYLMRNHSWNPKQLLNAIKTANEFRRKEIAQFLSNLDFKENWS